jgi:uncharacterized protein YktA (UPF0223 family)
MKIDVPEHWSAEQADVVLDFLEKLESAIWRAYEKQLIDLQILKANEPMHDDYEIDEEPIPF